MRFDPTHLETLLTIIEEGTFDSAARRLRITQSAVSQRIRNLETNTGQVLLRRSVPVVATAAGEPLVRLARQVRLLITETAASVGADEMVELAVAVNADSLATWFRPVLTAISQQPGVALKLHVEDQDYSHGLLRRGEVLAAVTSEPLPVRGCDVELLGALRYLPAAAPTLVEQHRRGRSLDWSTTPMVVFNEKDHLQDRVLTRRGASRPPVVHRVPSTADFHEAVVRGLGWGMIPEIHLEPEIAAGRLVRLPGGRPVEVPLHWQRWRLTSPVVDALTASVRAAAAQALS